MRGLWSASRVRLEGGACGALSAPSGEWSSPHETEPGVSESASTLRTAVPRPERLTGEAISCQWSG